MFSLSCSLCVSPYMFSCLLLSLSPYMFSWPCSLCVSLYLVFLVFSVCLLVIIPPRWPSGKASASRAEGPGFESRLRRDFFGVESFQ